MDEPQVNRKASSVPLILALTLLTMCLLCGSVGGIATMFTGQAVSSARNTQCKNNLRQLQMGIDSYQSSHEAYPGYQEELAGRVVPWTVTNLPFMERIDLYQDWSDPEESKPAAPYMDLLVCPSDPPEVMGGPNLSYVASAGLAGEKNQNKADGIFIDSAKTGEFVTADDIVDGKSNTFTLSENVQATEWTIPGKRDTVFVWHATTSPAADMRINGGDLKGPLTDNTARPSGYHAGGVNVSFADTHIVFLNEKIDYKVYIQLCTPNSRASSMPKAWSDYILNDEDYK